MLDLSDLTASWHHNQRMGLAMNVPKYWAYSFICKITMIQLTLSFHKVEIMTRRAICKMWSPVYNYSLLLKYHPFKRHTLIISNIIHYTSIWYNKLITSDATGKKWHFKPGFPFPFMYKNIHLVIKIKHSKE